MGIRKEVSRMFCINKREFFKYEMKREICTIIYQTYIYVNKEHRGVYHVMH